MRLLIIEDEQALADMVAQHLRTAGYEIDVCYDGDSGLEAATTESYDLIILDLNLLGLFGKLPQRPQTPSADKIGNGAG